MTETNETNEPIGMDEIVVLEPVRKSGGRSPAVRIGIVAGSALLVVVGAVAAMGASPAPATGSDPVAPAPTGAPGPKMPDSGRPGWGGPMGGFGIHGGMHDGDIGHFGFGAITITSIAGSDLALKTDDGWTRTISVTSTTTITKGGATIAVGDLAIGDEIRFAEEKATDGSYTITAIAVILPRAGGEVTAIDGQTLTVTQRDGTTSAIHVDADTTYQVDGAAGALSDIKVGSFIVAEGTLRADGSLDAADVHSGNVGKDGWHRGPGFPGMPGGPGDHDGQPGPNAPAPSTTPG